MPKFFKNTEPVVLSERAREILTDKNKTAQLMEAIRAERGNSGAPTSKSKITVRRVGATSR